MFVLARCLVWKDLDFYGVNYIITESVYCNGKCPGSGQKFSWIAGIGHPGHRDHLPPFCDSAPKSPLFKLVLRTGRNQFSVYEVLNKDGSRKPTFALEQTPFYLKATAGDRANADAKAVEADVRPATEKKTPAKTNGQEKPVTPVIETEEEEIDVNSIDDLDL